jgi:hypothetical protein
MSNRSVTSILAVVVLSAALPVRSADLARTLPGKWQADMVATTRDSAVYKELAPDDQKKLLEEWKNAPAVVYEFTDKTVVMKSGDSKPDNFSYTVLKAQGSKLALRFVSKREDGTEQADDNDVEIVDPDTLKISKKGEDGVVTLRRMK